LDNFFKKNHANNLYAGNMIVKFE